MPARKPLWPTSTDPEPRDSRFSQIIRSIIEVVPGGVIRAGKSTYASSSTGWWLGVDPADGVPKFHIGSSTYYLRWTGTRLEIAGSLTTKNGYVQIVDESTEDYGEGVTLLQAAWLTSGALRFKTATNGPGALITANNNGAGGTDMLIHAYPRTTGAGKTGTISLKVYDKAYGEAGANVYGFSISSAGAIQTTANLRLGGALDQVQLRIDANPDGQTADLIKLYNEAEAECFAVTPSGNVEILGNQVLGPQQAALADVAIAGTAEDGTARTKINTILAALRAHGLIDT